MARKPSTPRLELELKRVREKQYPPDLETLLIRIRVIAHEAGISQKQAGERMEPLREGQDRPIGKQRLSEYLLPARGPKPPPAELLEAYLQLYAEAEQIDAQRATQVRRELTALFSKAEAACEEATRETKKKPGTQKLAALERRIGLLLEDIAARDRELDMLRTESAESSRTHSQHTDRIQSLTEQVNELQRQLDEVVAERDELRAHRQRTAAELKEARERLIRVTAETDQQQARIDELESATGDADSPRELYPTAEHIRHDRHTTRMSCLLLILFLVGAVIFSFVIVYGAGFVRASIDGKTFTPQASPLGLSPGMTVLASIGFTALIATAYAYFLTLFQAPRLDGAVLTSRGVKLKDGSEISWDRIAELRLVQREYGQYGYKKHVIQLCTPGEEVLVELLLDELEQKNFPELADRVQATVPHVMVSVPPTYRSWRPHRTKNSPTPSNYSDPTTSSP